MKIKRAFCYDDVLLVPKKSTITSRSDQHMDTTVNLGKDVVLKVPILTANMVNVTGYHMIDIMSREIGGMAVMHRFYDERYDECEGRYKAYLDSIGVRSDNLYPGRLTHERIKHIAVSFGVTDEERKFFDIFEKRIREYMKIVCVDVAHGHHTNALRMVHYIKKKLPGSLVIAGNVATYEGARELADVGADVIKVGIGPGCFAAGTRILMANGTYKNIEDVKVGDRVINKDGQPKNVLKAFSTGTRKVSKVKNSIFYKDTYVTHDHKYFVGDLDSVSNETLQSHGYAEVLDKPKKNGDSKFGWQEIGTQTAKCLLMPRNIKFELPNSFCHDIYIRDGGNGHSSVKTKIDFSLEPSYELGYIFGTFLGDGHAMLANNCQTDTGTVNWYFGLGEGKIALRLRDAIKSVTGRDLAIAKGTNITKCILYHKPLAEFLSTFGKKKEKHLPEKFLVNNQPYLQGISDGLIDSDGNIEGGGRICLTNTSPQLIELFNIVTYLLTEVFPNNQKKDVSTGNLKNANIENFNTPYVARINKTASKRLVGNFQASKLLEYTETEEEVEVFDLTIDCDTHSFIANNAIVHNSLCTTRIETGNGVPQLTALEDARNALHDGGYYDVKLVADGGIKRAGDIVKALCFADTVMLGNLLAGCPEAPGDIITINDKKYKQYAGSSTHKARNIEGVIALVQTKPPVKEVIEKLMEGLRSGMSYQGVSNLIDLKKDPSFVEITNAGLVESKPHDVIL